MIFTDRRQIITGFLLSLSAFFLCSCHTIEFHQEEPIAEVRSEYDDANNWMFYPQSRQFGADTFFVAPTAIFDEKLNMDMNDENAKKSVLGATLMEKGLYDDMTDFYAPYYRQATLEVYEMSAEQRTRYLDIAYEDVKKAFSHYIKKANGGRPLVLAGFSQGADHVKRLLIDFPEIHDRLVAAYVIGWNITDQDLAEHPQLKMAERKDDVGVIVSFCSESVDLEDSILIPERTHAINPINWKTDATKGDKKDNLGACFVDMNGTITKEIPHLTGTYIDPARGALKVTDVSKKDYPAMLKFFKEGNFHIYDYQFFYRNIEKNVQTRIKAFETKKKMTSDKSR